MLSVWGDMSQSGAKISNGVNYFVMSRANKPKCTTLVMLVNDQLQCKTYSTKEQKNAGQALKLHKKLQPIDAQKQNLTR